MNRIKVSLQELYPFVKNYIAKEAGNFDCDNFPTMLDYFVKDFIVQSVTYGVDTEDNCLFALLDELEAQEPSLEYDSFFAPHDVYDVDQSLPGSYPTLFATAWAQLGNRPDRRDEAIQLVELSLIRSDWGSLVAHIRRIHSVES